MQHPAYRRKDRFLVPGKLYVVTTRPDRGTYMELGHPVTLHYFEQGTVVLCTAAVPGHYGHLKGILLGEFVDPMTGMDQTLSVMDVKPYKWEAR